MFANEKEERNLAKKKNNAPTPKELALSKEYMDVSPMPFKEGVGFLADRLATATSNWTIFAAIVAGMLVLAPIFYSLISLIAVLLNIIVVVYVSVFSFGLIYLAGATFDNLFVTKILFEGDFVGFIFNNVVPVTTMVTFVLSIVSTLLLFVRVKNVPAWRIVVSVLIFALYLLILILFNSGVIFYG